MSDDFDYYFGCFLDIIVEPSESPEMIDDRKAFIISNMPCDDFEILISRSKMFIYNKYFGCEY